jgi:transposase
MGSPMSLKDAFPSEIPPETARLVEVLMADDSVYRIVAECVNDFLRDEDFKDWYAIEGRPGINPIILSLVTLFQFLEKLPDRAAAQMAVMRLDWKYALRQPLDWTGFHYSDLCNFRKRLVAHGGESLIFERLLAYLRKRGLVQAGGRQRTDATHILGAVKQMSDVEVMREAVRMALSALVSSDALWVMRYIPASFTQNYERTISNYRMSKQELERFIQQTGEEARWLLDQLAQQAEVELQRLPEVAQLARIWEEQYHYVNEPERLIAVRQGDDKVINRIRNPHDPDVTYGTKGRGTVSWVGFKLHVTETLEAPRFITDVTLTSASARDVGDLTPIQNQLAERDLSPAKHYVDQGYMSGEKIAESLVLGINLRGYIGPDTQGKPPGFRLEDFDVDTEKQQAICPAGRANQRWVPATGNTDNRVAVHIFFGKQCLDCPFFGPDRCTASQTGRKLSLNAFHDVIQARRQEERTEVFQLEMYARAAIEGTISELVRVHGLRRARYRGAKKVRLQMLFTATATNLKRLAKAIADFCTAFVVDGECFAISPSLAA